MKRLVIAACLTVIGISNCRAETKQALTLHMESGARIVYYLKEEPSITFQDQKMLVAVGEESTSIAMEDVDHWEIGMAEYTGLPSSTSLFKDNISICGQELRIHNPSNQTIQICRLNGENLYSGTGAEVSLTLEKGIYVVRISNNSYKIAIL